ncbi:MAG: hypothetical protein KAV87_32790 [Desulfobacteraceae bacterium]|nr:hypothetical protein [Desulfobacteraceae bacterium]
MAIEGYAGSTTSKLALALGKGYAISATTFALTLGTAILAVVAGAVLVAQMTGLRTSELEVSDKKKNKIKDRELT